MKNIPLVDVSTLMEHVAKQAADKFYLYRGQNVDAPLLPKVARMDMKHDSTASEETLLAELRLRGSMLFEPSLDDWDLLCIAQHHGAATRLLDWSTNPLVGLWMALTDKPQTGTESVFVYTFEVDKEWMLPSKQRVGPFKVTRTRVLQPPLNNPRVAAQSGWFTAHIFNKRKGSAAATSRFVPLERQTDYSKKIDRFVVPVANRNALLIQLDKLGVNAQTMFPGIEGLCKHMSWRHECEVNNATAL